MPEPEREAIEKHLSFARNLHIETRILGGEDAAAVLLDFARRNGVTQIFCHPAQRAHVGPATVQRSCTEIISQAKDMQVVIVSDRAPVTR